MKKSLFLFVALILGMTGLQAQKPFQGTLTYKMELLGEGMEAYQAMMPTAISISVLKTKSRVAYEGGMFAAMLGTMLTDNKKGVTYMIRESEEMIYVMDPKAMAGDDEGTPETPAINKLDEVIDIAGYSCQKYEVVSNSPMGEQISYVWVTDQFVMPASEGSGAGGMGSGMVNMKGLPGMPLKVVSTQGPMTVSLTASNVDLTTPNKNDFKLPKGYKQEPFDPNSMMGGMGN